MLARDREQALALVAQLGTELNFWELGGFFQEGRRWLRRALEDTQGSVSIELARALLAAAELSSAITDCEYGQLRSVGSNPVGTAKNDAKKPAFLIGFLLFNANLRLKFGTFLGYVRGSINGSFLSDLRCNASIVR